MRCFINRLLVTWLLIITIVPAYAVNFDKIIVFGDSLSDNGNFYSATYKLIPRVPYYQGRFSNGPTWVEYFAEKINLNSDKKIELENFAYGGATAQANRNDIAWQINDYLKKSADDHDRANHLYVIWIGSNDYLRGNDNYETVKQTIASIRAQIEVLIQNGAKNMLVFGLPDIGKTPLARLIGHDYSMQASKIVRMHNAKLVSLLKHERIRYPEMNIVYFNMTEYFNDAMTHPGKYGMTNVDEACYKGDTFLYAVLRDPKYAHVKKPEKLPGVIIHCLDADEHLFWDHVHPSRVAHEKIAEAVYQRLHETGLT